MTHPALLVRAGGAVYGLPLGQCAEIVERPVCTPLPGSEGFVRGLVNLRGRLVTVLDLGAWLGAAASAEHAGHGIVVLEHGEQRVGLAVDEVVRIAQVEAAPLPGGTGAASGIGLHRCAGAAEGAEPQVIGLLDTDAVVGPVFAR